jgi:hypothetical protein
MTNPMIKLVNATTGEEIEREMTSDEFAEWEANRAEWVATQKIESEKAAHKAALLTKLGITEDEAKLLLS